MYNFKFHLVTVVGIFLALALGIFIGSTFTEEGIIIQQRGTIERMREDIDSLHDERRELHDSLETQAETILLLQDWLGGMRNVYWQANPVDTKAVLIQDGSFNPDCLGPYLGSVIQAQVVLDSVDFAQIGDLVQAVISGDISALTWLEEGVSGEPAVPDFIFLAIEPGAEPQFAAALATAFLDAELPVVALGDSTGQGLADLVSHPLYSSVSHLDTPLGLYCLGAILQGQGGHYGPNNLLPPGEAGR